MTFLSQFRHGGKLSTPSKVFLVFALSVLLVIVMLQTWALAPDLVTEWAVRFVLAICVLITLFEFCSYLHRLLMRQSHQQFSVRQVFVVTTIVAIFSAIGYLLDALMVPVLVAFTLIVGPMALRLVTRRYPVRAIQQTVCLSVLLFLLYAVLVAVISVVTILLLPSDPAWLRGAILLKAALVPSAMIAYLFLGDDYKSGSQLLMYGAPLGVPITLGIWAIAGAAVGAVTHFFIGYRNNKPKETRAASDLTSG